MINNREKNQPTVPLVTTMQCVSVYGEQKRLESSHLRHITFTTHMYNHPTLSDLKTTEHIWQLHRHSAALPDEPHFCLVMNKVRLPDDIQLKMCVFSVSTRNQKIIHGECLG